MDHSHALGGKKDMESQTLVLLQLLVLHGAAGWYTCRLFTASENLEGAQRGP